MLQKAIELLVSCFATAELFNVTVLVQPQSKKHFKCFNFHSFSKTNRCSAHLWISASHTHYKWGVFFPTFATWRTVIMNNCAKHYHSGIFSSGFLLVIKWGQRHQCIFSYCINALRTPGECDSTILPAIANFHYKWHWNPLPTVLLLLTKVLSTGFWCNHWKTSSLVLDTKSPVSSMFQLPLRCKLHPTYSSAHRK